ncbi:hypothetical protein [Deinococcus wulumuqiensis]|uniref:hypothetical protein n=1 Tax=Deinococcus wulumuqiensis TaxID=980427 RepID=UPI001375B5B6|nr:hypothetical protein [Deinococcus wulumuqiensis]QII20437.1 hypothetical protein G6R31_06460 [Deinococcus wulumuqiensis R12]
MLDLYKKAYPGTDKAFGNGRQLIRIPLNSCTVGKAPPVHPYRGIRIFSYSHPLGLNLKLPDSIGIRITWNGLGTPASIIIQPVSGGTRVEYRRKSPVSEQLELDLEKALLAFQQQQKKSPWTYLMPPDCASLGLRSSARYAVGECAVLPGNLLGRGPTIAVSISRSADASVPLGTMRYFTADQCGPHFTKEKP